MITESTSILKQFYKAIATLVLMVIIVGGGIFVLEIQRLELERKLSHYHLSSITLASASKLSLFQANGTIEKINSLEFNSSEVSDQIFLLGKNISEIRNSQENFKSLEFVFINHQISERFDDLQALADEGSVSKIPFLRLTSRLILEFERLERLHHAGANKTLKKIDQIENKIYPIIFLALILSILAGGWGLKLSVSRIKNITADKDAEYSARIKAQERLKQSDIIVASSLEMIALLDKDYRYLMVNPAYQEMVKKNEEQLIGKTAYSVFGEELFNGVIKPNADRCLGGEEVHFQEWFDFPNSDKRYMDISYFPHFDNNKKVVGFIVSARDVTERRKAEELTTRFGRILDDSSNEIYIFNASTLYLSQANFGARNNLGYSIEELTHLTPLDLKPEYTLDIFEKLIKPIREKLKPEVVFETMHKRKNGTLYPVLVRLQLMHDETPPVFVAIIGDITKQKKYEAELEKHRDHLSELVDERTRELKHSQKQLVHSEKLSALGKLTTSISHEFNNPLQGLRNVIDILSRSAPSEKEVKLADMAKRECDRMAKMIVSLRSFSKPSSGKVSSVDINQCMEEVLYLQTKPLEERCIQVNHQFSDNLPRVEAVEDQIKQVILNIIQNAAEAISGEGQITITTEKQDSHVIIKIQDTGHGMSEDHKKNIFEPFFTTKDTEQGTGLGLSISYGIIQDHDGDIKVESEPNKGATFIVALPLKG